MKLNNNHHLLSITTLALLIASIPTVTTVQAQTNRSTEVTHEDSGAINLGDASLFHIRELDCPFPASWQFRIYNPKPEGQVTKLKVKTGICHSPEFSADEVNLTDSAPMPIRSGTFVLSITILPDKEGQYRCHAYITEVKFCEHVEPKMPTIMNKAPLSDVRAKYFQTSRRVPSSGRKHGETRVYQPGTVAPLILLKQDQRRAEEDAIQLAKRYPVVWLEF